MPPGPIAACFRCASAAAAPSSGAAAGPSLATSVYETHLGLVALSWSRAPLGLSLRAVLRLSPPSTPGAASSSSAASGAGYLDDDADANDEDETTLAFRVRPWLLWRRRGSRRFRAGGRLVDLAWDLSRARFPGSGSPEPSSGFFVAIVVDGEMVLAAGDLPDAAYRRTRARRPPGTQRPVLLSRREHVSLRDAGAGRGRSHTTWVTVQGKERQISVDLVARGRGRDKEGASAAGRDKEKEKERADVGMSVSVDGERVLHVRRLRWKFRGSERVDLGGGGGVQVSWDLHNWLFPARDPPPPADASAHAHAHAVLVFRFDLAATGGGDEEERGADSGKDPSSPDKAATGRRSTGGVWGGYLARWGQRDWSETDSNGERRRKGRAARRLAKESSSSSASVASSTASWASSSTVMDWASPEEAEMQRGDGFSLVIYAWKS